MARNKSINPAIVLTFILIFLGTSLGQKCIAGSQEDMVGSIHSPQGKQSRVRRQACEEYKHEGRTCCKCGAGYKLKEHCRAQKDDQKCELCEDGTYNSEPNSLMSCEPCKSCSQPSANLEVAIPCSRTTDTVCRCKVNHYCISDTHTCTECGPCKVCDPGVGVKVSCSLTNNTICNETNKLQGNTIAAIVLCILILLAVPFIVIGIYLWKKRKIESPNLNPPPSGNGELEMGLLHVNEDLIPHIPTLATEIGWLDMRNIAMGTISIVAIESVELDYRQDSQERTIRLLRIWAEVNGKEASKKLIEGLINRGKKGKAEKVMEILSVSNS